jgi:predicted kinase
MRKTIHLLIGPKGAGKTCIGKLVERELGIRFLRVEPIWLALQPEQDGWQAVEQAVDKSFETTDELTIESLGIGAGFDRMCRSLAGKYRLRRIKIAAGPEVCLRRVHSRNATDHIPGSDADVAAYNRVAAEVVHPWSVIIDNNGSATKAQIVAAFRLP